MGTRGATVRSGGKLPVLTKGTVGMDRQAPLLRKAHLRSPVHLWAIHTGRAQPGREEVGYLSWGWGGVAVITPILSLPLVIRTYHQPEQVATLSSLGTYWCVCLTRGSFAIFTLFSRFDSDCLFLGCSVGVFVP